MGHGSVVHLGSDATSVAVDYWWRAESFGAHFLTHLHSDHTEGLRDSWGGRSIHCTDQTADLLAMKWPGLSSRVVRLEMWQPSVVALPGGRTFTVTPLEANHCVVR